MVTPYARSAYGRGEAIRGRVMVRTAANATAGEVQLRLVDDAGCEVWNVAHENGTGTDRRDRSQSHFADGTRSVPAAMDFVVPAEVTLALRPGGSTAWTSPRRG